MVYIHNSHLEAPSLFAKKDPHLKKLLEIPLPFVSPLIKDLPSNIPGVYTIGGGRQIGKTTLLKQWMDFLIKEKTIDPKQIFFFTGELIEDHLDLIKQVDEILTLMEKENKNSRISMRFIIIDEVTYIKSWDKGVKFLADAGKLENVILLLTGSDLLMMKEAIMRLPGRRGKSEKTDFHYFPLSFREATDLKLDKIRFSPSQLDTDKWLHYFDEYLIHGGFLKAINEFSSMGAISGSTYQTYSDWVRGDILKQNKKENYLESLVKGIIKRYGSQVTWNSLSKDLPIDHPTTISDYAHLLERSDVCSIIESLVEDKLTAAPKKGKKIFFNDPFILKALAQWTSIDLDLNAPEFKGHIVESVVMMTFKRKYPAFFINAEGEVDLAYIKNKRFFPVEVKWTGQLRPKDLKQIKKYPQGIILGRMENKESTPPVFFLPKFIYDV